VVEEGLPNPGATCIGPEELHGRMAEVLFSQASVIRRMDDLIARADCMLSTMDKIRAGTENIGLDLELIKSGTHYLAQTVGVLSMDVYALKSMRPRRGST